MLPPFLESKVIMNDVVENRRAMRTQFDEIRDDATAGRRLVLSRSPEHVAARLCPYGRPGHQRVTASTLCGHARFFAA